MKSLLLFAALLCGCAYGVGGEKTESYGRSNPSTTSDAEAPDFNSPGSGDPANDPYETGCFWNAIRQSDGTFTFFYVCDGSPFSVQDLIDPPPDGKQNPSPLGNHK